MEYQQILENVAKHITLDEDEIQFFLSLLEANELAKKSYLIKEGQPCRCINFVISGTLRAYYLNQEGKESTVMFAVKDWWITDMNCFVNGLPSMLNICALEDSCVLELTKEKMDVLLNKIPKFERFFRILFQNAYIREQLRVIQHLSTPAEERYENFLQKYPQITPHLTQRQIASYLGITPEFLSNIRNKRIQ